MSTVKVAVIGAGRWGRNIVRTLHELGALCAVAEADQTLLNRLQQDYPQIETCNDYQALLAKLDPGVAVAIATPVKTHYQIAKAILLSGRDVFIEKPMAMNTSECEALLASAKRQNKILMVGHMLLYQPAIQFIKDYLASGQLGSVYSLRQVRRNLGTVRVYENVLYSLGVHDLAVLSYLVGEKAESIQVVGQALLNQGVEDDMSIHIQYPANVQAHLHMTWLWPVKERSLMILAEKGALLFDELTQTVTLFRNYANPDASIIAKGGEVVFKNEGQALKNEMQHFIECLTDRTPPLSSGEQGLEVVKLMETISAQVHDVSECCV